MTPVEIKNACKSLENTITKKGYYNPKVDVSICWIGYDLTVHLSYRTDAHTLIIDKFIHCDVEDGFYVLISHAEDFITTLQPIVDAKRNAFIAAVGKLIEQGRDIGMEVEFLNPLTAMMEKLSTNIITHRLE